MFQLKWVWSRLEGFHGRYIFALCSTVLIAASQLVTSLITANIMDTVFYPLEDGGFVTQAVIDRLIFLILILVGFTLLRTSFNYCSVMTYEHVSQQVTYRLRRDLYKNMQEQDQDFFSKNPHRRLDDPPDRRLGHGALCRGLGAAAAHPLHSAVCHHLHCVPGDRLALRPVHAGGNAHHLRPYPGVLQACAPPVRRPAGAPLPAEYPGPGEHLRQPGGKGLCREDYEIERFDEKNADYKKANTKASLLWLQYSPMIDGLSQALSIAVLLVGGVFLIIGRISIGTFTMFNSLCWTLTSPMRMLGMHINDLQRFFASANKIIELYYSRSTIATRPDAVSTEKRIEGRIDFEHAGLKLHGTKVLHDIDLHIEPGETVAIMGPTGSGKTSLINLIPRFTDVSEGEVKVDGIKVGLYPLHKLRGSIGLATQDVFLFSDTVDGNIAYGDSDMSEDDVKRYAKMACVDFADKLPEGFDTIIGERGTGLSGGQKQRIALARALAVRPSILILDDTTSAVDLETEKYIQEQLSALDFACTKIIIAQRISTTKRADRIVVLDKGTIVQCGTHEELSRQPGYYREVFLLQNGEK